MTEEQPNNLWKWENLREETAITGTLKQTL